MDVKKVILRMGPFYKRAQELISLGKRSSSVLPARPVSTPPSSIYRRGNLKAEDIAETPLYRAYCELNGGRPLAAFDAEITWSDKLPEEVLTRQLGTSFALLGDDALVLLRIRSNYENSRELLVIFDQKTKLVPLVKEFIEKRVQLTPISYDSLFLLQIEGERVHLEMASNLNPYLMRKGLMLETLDVLFHRHFPGFTVTTEAVNIKLIKWIAERYQAELLGPQLSQSVPNASLQNFDRLVIDLKEAGAIAPEDAEELLTVGDVGTAYCLLNSALEKQEPGQPPLRRLIFLIENIPISYQDLPKLAIAGKIPIS